MLRPGNLLLFIEAALMLGSARLALTVVPFRVLARRRGEVRGATVTGERGKVRRVRHGLDRVTPWLPFHCSCLTRALAGRWMLRRRGVPSVLHVGVAKPGPSVSAHAWLTVGELVVCGDGDGDAFTPIGRFPS